MYSVGGLLLALNSLMLPQTLNLNGALQRAMAPVAIQAAEAKTEKTTSTVAAVVKDEKPAVKRTIFVTVTAYSSTPDQTDSTPFITANGTHVRDGIIAANFLKFGAKVRFPDYSGDKIYEVTDRMNARYPDRADIWMESREEAIVFGIRTLKMEILP